MDCISCLEPVRRLRPLEALMLRCQCAQLCRSCPGATWNQNITFFHSDTTENTAVVIFLSRRIRFTASLVCLLTRHRLFASPVFICLTRQASLCLIKQTFKPSKIYYSSSQHGSSARTNSVGAICPHCLPMIWLWRCKPARRPADQHLAANSLHVKDSQKTPWAWLTWTKKQKNSQQPSSTKK